MNTTAFSIKMANSKKFKDSQARLKYILALLKQQLKLTISLMEENEDLRKKGYQQYRTYSHNKRRDKITTIPSLPVYKYKIYDLLRDIETFFEWEHEARKNEQK